MRILVFSDSHSSWNVLYRMIEIEIPDLIICAGDWGDRESDIKEFLFFIKNMKIPIVSVYGNHDNVDVIMKSRGNYKWLPSFQAIEIQGLKIMGINGNFAQHPRHPWHMTEESVRDELKRCSLKDIDIVVSHENPKGYGDILTSHDRDKEGRPLWKKNIGFESLTEVLKKLEPRFWFSAHHHQKQVAQYQNTIIYNCGYGVKGDYIVIDLSKKMKPYELLWCMRRLGEDENGKTES